MSRSRMRAFLTNETGAGLLEYGLLIGLVVFLAIGAIGTLGRRIEFLFADVNAAMTGACPVSRHVTELETEDGDHVIFEHAWTRAGGGGSGTDLYVMIDFDHDPSELAGLTIGGQAVSTDAVADGGYHFGEDALEVSAPSPLEAGSSFTLSIALEARSADLCVNVEAANATAHSHSLGHDHDHDHGHDHDDEDEDEHSH